MNNTSPPLPSDSQKDQESSINSGSDSTAPSIGGRYQSYKWGGRPQEQQQPQEPSPGKKIRTIRRTVEPGHWRIGTEPGAKIHRVLMKDLRGRLFELARVEHSELMSYVRKMANGRAVDNVVLRGTPIMWTAESHMVLLYPSPLHEWEFHFEIEK